MATDSNTLAGQLNRLAGTTDKDPTAAANAWAGRDGLPLQAALNAAAGTDGVGIRDTCNTIAGTSDYDPVSALATVTMVSTSAYSSEFSDEFDRWVG